jgi:peptidoglycan-N-acetylglucosamine deacetylase
MGNEQLYLIVMQSAVVTILVIILVGLILFYQPRWLLSLFSRIIPGVTYFLATNKPVVALTIDDSPDPQTTPAILEILAKYQAKATFFLITNQVKGNEDLVKEIVKQGHELGNHLTEDYPSIKLTTEDFTKQVKEAEAILSKFSQIRWLRPASGWYNQEMIKIANSHNYRVVLGDIFPYDTHINSSKFAITMILANLKPGSIIILHDGGERGERTAKTLAKVLPKIQAQGNQIVNLSELWIYEHGD